MTIQSGNQPGGMLEAAKRWARLLKRDVVALYRKPTVSAALRGDA